MQKFETRVTRILTDAGISFQVRMHSKPALTVLDAARERQTSPHHIVKAMVLSGGGENFIVLLPGDRKLSLSKVRKALGNGKIDLATPDRIAEITGYQIGAVSPVGIRCKGTAILLDKEILQLDSVDISSGDPCAGVRLDPVDLCQLTSGVVGHYSKE